MVSIWIPHILKVPLGSLLCYCIIIEVPSLLPLSSLRLRLLSVAHVFYELARRLKLLLSSQSGLLLLHLHHHASLLLLLLNSLVVRPISLGLGILHFGLLLFLLLLFDRLHLDDRLVWLFDGNTLARLWRPGRTLVALLLSVDFGFFLSFLLGIGDFFLHNLLELLLLFLVNNGRYFCYFLYRQVVLRGLTVRSS